MSGFRSFSVFVCHQWAQSPVLLAGSIRGRIPSWARHLARGLPMAEVVERLKAALADRYRIVGFAFAFLIPAGPPGYKIRGDALARCSVAP